MSYPEIIILVIAGMAIGSFTNNLVNLFTGRGFDWKRSSCSCGDRGLRYTELFPVVTYLVLRGRCTECNRKIPVRYFIVEIISPIVFLLLYESGHFVISLYMIVLSWFFVIISVVDLESFTIPDSILLSGLITEIGFRFYEGKPLTDNLGMAIIVFLAFVAIKFIVIKFKKVDPLGWGDIKFFLLLVFIFGIVNFLTGLWVASILGLLLKHATQRENLIPFGFFLGVVFLIFLLGQYNFEKIILEWLTIQ